MKTKSLKALAGALLAAIMLLSIIPMSAMAVSYNSDGNITAVSFTLDKFDYGNMVISAKAVSEKSGPLNIAYIEKTTFYESSKAVPTSKEDLVKTEDTSFQAGKQYFCAIEFSKHSDLAENIAFDRKLTAALTCNGASCEQVLDLSENNKLFVYKLPVLEAVPYGIDVTTVVEQGGSVAPTKGEFELEVLNAEENSNLPIDSFTVGNKNISTDGKGSFDSKLTIGNDDCDKLLYLSLEGFFVKQKKGDAEGWSYDESVWFVQLHQDPVVNSLDDKVETVPNIKFDCFKGKMVDGEFEAETETPADKITFTNTYTENEPEHTHNYTQKYNETDHWNECDCGAVENKEAHKFGEWKVTAEATETAKGAKQHTCSVCGYSETAEIDMLVRKEIPQTGDNSTIGLWIALLFIGSAGVVGTTVFSRKRRSMK